MMENKYSTLIDQTFNFPQEGFHTVEDELYFNEHHQTVWHSTQNHVFTKDQRPDPESQKAL
jgi:hypothetical protein